MATNNLGIVGRAAGGPSSIWTGGGLTDKQIAEARGSIQSDFGGTFNAQGVYDSSDNTRNLSVAGGLKAMGLTADQSAAVTGISAADINKFYADNGATTDLTAAKFRDDNPTLFKSDAIVGGVPDGTPAPTPAPSRPLPTDRVMSATTERIGKPTEWNVTGDQTVEGRIARLIDPNNPLNVQVATASNEDMVRRGIVNSSIASSGAQDAILRNAMPIAQADAATFAKAGGYNADQVNQANTKNAEMGNTVGIANLNANNSWAQANLGANTQLANTRLQGENQRELAGIEGQNRLDLAGVEGQNRLDVTDRNNASQMTLTALQNDSRERIATLDSATRIQAQTLQNDSTELINTNEQAARAFNQYMIAAAQIQNNDKMDGPTKSRAMATLFESTRTQLSVIGKISGLDLTSDLDMTGEPGYDAQGKWVGFNAEGATNTPGATPEPTSAPVAGGSGWQAGGEAGQ